MKVLQGNRIVKDNLFFRKIVQYLIHIMPKSRSEFICSSTRHQKNHALIFKYTPFWNNER